MGVVHQSVWSEKNFANFFGGWQAQEDKRTGLYNFTKILAANGFGVIKSSDYSSRLIVNIERVTGIGQIASHSITHLPKSNKANLWMSHFRHLCLENLLGYLR